VSIELAALAVPAEQRARFLESARRIAERAEACRCSQVELQLALRVLSVLFGAGAAGARGTDG
jgi:hypothetical protein